jgi:transketolase
MEMNGHDFDDIEKTITKAIGVKRRPVCIVAETVKGKGVSFMENQVGWHGTAPNEEQFEKAMEELTAEFEKTK